jgi:methylase of polypeptide subunit release factors
MKMFIEQKLNPAQQKQVEKQIRLHTKCTKPFVFKPIELDKGTVLDKLIVYPGVLWPMSSRRLAAFLYRNRNMFEGKTVIDMGSGCGLQGITAALYGASHVIMSDFTEPAYQNTLENVSRYGLTSKCDVRYGDLFENVPEDADIIVFAHPYFPGTPNPSLPFTYGMLNDGELINRFLDHARSHVKDRIVMCQLDLAGDVNNPRIHAPKYGYRILEHDPELLSTGEQQGAFWVYELSLE